jgi:hypothetical protein
LLVSPFAALSANWLFEVTLQLAKLKSFTNNTDRLWDWMGKQSQGNVNPKAHKPA